ncbi:PHP domain-containing protein [candidate division KSB1 bacterium]|nr:MAG: PHP domain-containing protein [candidate division KSB1 bacterium]
MVDEWIDLHVHTHYSDGMRSPEEMVREAKKAGLKALGIVDHDTVDGLKEAESAGQKLGVEIVPGVELSSQYKGMDIHILGYYFNRESSAIKDYLKKFQDERFVRAEKIVKNLQKIGVNISLDEVINKSKGKNIGRPHIADVLLERGYVETFQEAFYRYIGYGSESYVEKFKITPQEAVSLIAEAGGLSFLAHPGPSISDQMIVEFAKAGLNGIEIVHPKHSQSRTSYLQRLARKLDLMVCGGSDCHGGREGKITIGLYVIPYTILTEFKEIIEVKRSEIR